MSPASLSPGSANTYTHPHTRTYQLTMYHFPIMPDSELSVSSCALPANDLLRSDTAAPRHSIHTGEIIFLVIHPSLTPHTHTSFASHLPSLSLFTTVQFLQKIHQSQKCQSSTKMSTFKKEKVMAISHCC